MKTHSLATHEYSAPPVSSAEQFIKSHKLIMQTFLLELWTAPPSSPAVVFMKLQEVILQSPLV